MKKTTALVAALPLVLAGCRQAPAEPAATHESSLGTAARAPAPVAEEDSSRWASFGAPLDAGVALPVRALLDDAERNAGRTVLVEGTVDSVCQAKGCWMVLADGGREMRVKFKDYGFFVPTDIAGRTVRFEGVFSVEMVPVEEARHYLEDAGRHEEATKITEPQRSFTFEATGVRVEPAS